MAEAPTPARRFTLFAALPAELRLKIWHFSFGPRVVEVHTRKAHYADDDRFGDAKWQSRSRNPPALAASAEARSAALEHYTVALPLAREQPHERSGPGQLDRYRRLYISPAADTVVVLGELNVRRVGSLCVHLLTRGAWRR